MSSPPSDDSIRADSTQADEAQRVVPSPCIQVCRLDVQSICIGCGRHIDEIVAWQRLSAEQQRSICEQAARRLAAYGKR